MAYERNFGNVTYNVLFNPPHYLVSTIDAPDRRRVAADLHRQCRPVRRHRRRQEDHPCRQPRATSIRTSRRHTRTSTACRSSASSRPVRRCRWTTTGRPDAISTIWLTPTNAARRSFTKAPARARRHARQPPGRTRNTPRSTRAATAACRSTTASRSRSIRATSPDAGVELTGRVHGEPGEGQPEHDVLGLATANFNLGYLDAFNPSLDYGYCRVRRSAPAQRRRHLEPAFPRRGEGHERDAARRLVAERHPECSQRLSVHVSGTARTGWHSACARSTLSASQGASDPGPLLATRTSTRCSIWRPSSRPPAATSTPSRAIPTLVPTRRP